MVAVRWAKNINTTTGILSIGRARPVPRGTVDVVGQTAGERLLQAHAETRRRLFPLSRERAGGLQAWLINRERRSRQNACWVASHSDIKVLTMGVMLQTADRYHQQRAVSESKP